MTASRWNNHVLEILDWIEEDDLALEELIFKPVMTRILQNEAELAEQEQVERGHLRVTCPGEGHEVAHVHAAARAVVGRVLP